MGSDPREAQGKHLTKTPNPAQVTSLCAPFSLEGSDKAPLPLAATEGKAKEEKMSAFCLF